MQEIVIETLVRGVVLPLLVTVVAVGVIRFGLGDSIGKPLAAGAIAIGTMASIMAMDSWPSFPPISASQKFVYLVLFGLILGALIDLVGSVARFRRLLTVLWSTAVVGWIGWRQLAALDPGSIISLALIDIAGIAVLWRLHDEPGPAPTVPVALIAACIGAAAIAFIGQSSSISRFYGALAAAIGGYVLWNWPTPRYPFGSVGVLSAGGAFLALTTIMFQFTETNTLALVFVLPVFLCPAAARMTRYGESEATAAVATGIISAAPVVLAIAIAIIMEPNALNSP